MSKDKQARSKDFTIIHKPIFTEKSTLLSTGKKTGVAFKVAKTASKDDIREAVERIFSVEVDSVRTCNYMGKQKRMGTSTGKRSSFKKAYVTLKEGNSIDLVEGL